MKPKIYLQFVRYLLALICSTWPLASQAQSNPPTLPRAVPTIEYYNASHAVVHLVQAVRLSWKVHNAVRVDVYDGFRNTTYEQLGNENYIEVWPEKTAKYILHAYGANGEISSRELTILVEFHPILVDQFTAAPQVVDPRQAVKIWWRVQNARIVDIFDVTLSTTYPNLGLENYIMVYPEKTSRYILMARGDGNRIEQRELIVYVREYEPTIEYFHAGTYLVNPGEGVLLRWKVSHAVRAEIFDGSKNVSYPVGLQGEILVHPDRSAVFYLYAYDEEGKVTTAQIYIRVKQVH